MRTYLAAVIGCGHKGRRTRKRGAPHPTIIPPHAHAEAFYTYDRTDLVACSDLREDLMRDFGDLHDVPRERQYLDYRELIDREKPEIISVATQPEQRAKIIIYAAEHGVKAIYAEKALAASLAEADAIAEACDRNGAVLNMGTNRRWMGGYQRMKEIIDGGEIGELKTLIAPGAQLFNHLSHMFDVILLLNSDRPVAWVSAQLEDADNVFQGDALVEDSMGHGMLRFENGVTAYNLKAHRRYEVEAICERGFVSSLQGLDGWELYRQGPRDQQDRPFVVPARFPYVPRASSTLRIIEDLVHSLDTGEPPRGGVQIARYNTELIIAFIESHRRGGARVELPLKESNIRLQRGGTKRLPINRGEPFLH